MIQINIVFIKCLRLQEVDKQPLREANIHMFGYFVVFIVFGVFLCANLIIGILVKQILSTKTLNKAIESSSKSTRKRSSQEINGSESEEVFFNLIFFVKSFIPNFEIIWKKITHKTL